MPAGRSSRTLHGSGPNPLGPDRAGMTGRTVINLNPGDRIFRYEVGVNDTEWRLFHLTGDPLHVSGLEGTGIVEFWAPHRPGQESVPRWFMVVGTGHDVPEFSRYWGTSPRLRGEIWHLIERTSP